MQPTKAEYPPHTPSTSVLSRSVSPYSYSSSATRSPGPNTSYDSRSIHTQAHTSHPTSSTSSRISPNRAKHEMYSAPMPSSHLHPSLTSAHRHQTSSLRSHPYRSSSRASTASSVEDTGEASNYSDNDWDQVRSGTRGVGRKDSIYSSRSAPLLGESSGSESRRALMTNSADDGSYTASLSSPTASSPTFTFVPHSTQPSSGPLSLDSLPNYPPDQKPPFSYPVLIRLAILGSPQKRLLLSQIYASIEEKFPWYRDSAPKAWKASVRHCLSLNKEFVRMQRAVEDPGVGCGGWWSVGEGMKGLKRPRKRRPAQNRRGDNDAEDSASHSPIIKEPSPGLRRRHSVQSNMSKDSYPPFAASPPIASLRTPTSGTLPSLQDYSLQLAPLQLLSTLSQEQLSNPLLPSPLVSNPNTSGVFNFGRDRERGRSEDVWAPASAGVGRGSTSSRGQSHASTPSTSSSYSAHSRSDTSSLSGRRQNPMNISNLLNEGNNVAISTQSFSIPQSNVITTEHSPPTIPMELDLEDVEMKGKYTPFSSDQTLRPPSPQPSSPVPSKQSRSERSRQATSNARSEKAAVREKTPHRERTPHREKTPSTRRPATASGETPPPPGKSPKPSSRPATSSGSLSYSTQDAGSSSKTTEQQTGLGAPKKERTKAWDSVMDLSKMIMGKDED